jgi:MFS family permease
LVGRDRGARIDGARIRPSLGFAQTFVSFGYRNYRLWFFGQLISLIGTWTQSTAQGFLVFELTQSPAYLGYVSFAAGVPAWIFTLWAGIAADRLPRRNLLVLLQASMMLPAILLSVLSFTNLVRPWHILFLAVILGIANAFDAPVRQAFVPELVARQDMTNAIALNASMFNSAVVIGPAIGGVLYAAVGPAWCFAVNAVSFLAVILALLLMKIQPVPPPPKRQITPDELKVGVNFVAKNRPVLLLIATVGMVSIFGMGLMALMPAWAVKVLNGDAQTNGLILSARGSGALIGSIIVAALGRMRFRGRLWSVGIFLMPAMILAFSLTTWLPLSLVLLMGVGLGFMLVNNTSNALVQTRVPDELRGRVMSVFILVFFGSFPIGSLLAGQMAEFLGEPLTIFINSLVLLVYVAIIWVRFPDLRRLE